jgi:MFS transporter, PAT family, beta-lactamase induction signal transducer AmpG
MSNEQQHSFANPFYFFFLVLPAGISMGFATITLPYLLTKNGFSVAVTADIVAIGVSANIWRFVWGPVADLTLSLRRWYWIGVIGSALALILLCFTPFTVKGSAWLTVIVFVSQVAATFVLLPVGGLMANRVEEGRKGRASGWYQAGNLGGVGLGGGAGLWLATHYSVAIAGMVLSAFSIVVAMAIWKVQDVPCVNNKKVMTEIVMMGKDILTMLRVPVVLFIIIMICLPIGTGAAANLWSAIADDWKTDADTVALVTGILSGLVSAVGCVLGGFIADRWGNWVAYLGSGLVCALVTVTMALFPYQPYIYVTGVLAYAFGLGLMNAAFSSVLLYAIGKKNAATKYSLLSSLGNLPVVYMTTFDGWAHDRHNSKYMLVAEAAVCVFFVVVCILALSLLRAKKMLLQTID